MLAPTLCELPSTNTNFSYSFCYWCCQVIASQALPLLKECMSFQIDTGNAKRKKKNPAGGGKASQSKLRLIYYHE